MDSLRQYHYPKATLSGIRIMSPVLRVLVVCLVITLPLAAHGDLHERIAALTKQIDDAPTNAELYLKRGELHRAHRDWKLALARSEERRVGKECRRRGW